MPSVPPVQLHQCLFGYDDGHRMLASSLQLADDDASKLLLLSDLAPNLDPSAVDDYWTGMPLPTQRYFALMRTWLAPEMPRPGCVWTQVILLSFADIGRFVDLQALTYLFVRPVRGHNFSGYSDELFLDASLSGPRSDVSIDPAAGIEVLRALYASRTAAILSSTNGGLDTVIFRAWSQQWPQLRRSFSFRTASNYFESSGQGIEFDLQVSIVSSQDHLSNSALDNTLEPWESAALEDLKRAEPSGLRRFYWRYGSDLRRGRERFRFLTEIYLATRSSNLEGAFLQGILLMVSKTFPNPNTAKVLKEDLVSCGHNAYSLIPPADPLNLLAFFVNRDEAPSLPNPPPQVIQSLKELWPVRANEILTIAEFATKHRSVAGQKILETFDNIVFPQDPLTITREYPALRYHLIANNPNLLDSDELVSVSEGEILQFLNEIPISISLAEHLVDRLLWLELSSIAHVMFVKYSTVVLRRVSHAIIHANEHLGRRVAKPWLKSVSAATPEFFRLELLGRSTSTTTLAAFLDILGTANSVLWYEGPIPWATAFAKVKDDVTGSQRQKLFTFFVAISCSKPVPSCEPLFEASFEYVHDQLFYSKLSADLLDFLLPNLPDLSWWDGWDLCLRLKLAVIKAYTVSGLSARSFQRLTKNKSLQYQLEKLLAKTKKGRRFMRGFSPDWHEGSNAENRLM